MKARTRLALKGGRAERARAPVRDVVILLAEFQDLVQAIGHHLAGTDVPEDVIERSCRVELVGLSFGSLVPELELASETDEVMNPLGTRALEAACRAFIQLRDPSVDPGSLVGQDAIASMDRIGSILDHGYEAVEITYQSNGHRITGILDDQLRSQLLHDVAQSVTVEGVTVSGVLFGLADRPSEREKTQFVAEMLDDTGQLWSIRFPQEATDLARNLWKRRVELTGTVRYFRARRPILYVERAVPRDETSMLDVLDRARGAWKDLYQGQSLEQIISDLR